MKNSIKVNVTIQNNHAYDFDVFFFLQYCFTLLISYCLYSFLFYFSHDELVFLYQWKACHKQFVSGIHFTIGTEYY